MFRFIWLWLWIEYIFYCIRHPVKWLWSQHWNEKPVLYWMRFYLFGHRCFFCKCRYLFNRTGKDIPYCERCK